MKNNLSTIISAIGSIKTGADGIDSGLTKMNTAVEGSIENITNLTSKNSETAKALSTLGTNTSTSIQSLKTTKKALETTADEIEDEEAKNKLLTQVKSLDEQITALEKNVATERAAYNKAMETETTQVLRGLNTLKTSLETLKGVSSKVTAGINQLVSGSPELQEGLNKLEEGSNSLTSGAKSLSDGTNTLSSGATTLSDGMKQFDNKGISTIYNFVNGDVKGAENRVQKLMDLAKESSSYKYILKVDDLK